MYMDDMLFSRDTLDEAQLVAKKAVELLDSRGFELVKGRLARRLEPSLLKWMRTTWHLSYEH